MRLVSMRLVSAHATRLDAMTTLSRLGESEVLARLLKGNPDADHVLLGPGDDAAVTAVEGRLVSTADMLVENEDFTRDWLDWSALGRKAAAQNLADVCAMGARPHGLLVSFAVPNSTMIDDLEALFSGIVTEAARAGDALGAQVPIIGGDLSSSGLIVIAITALGTVAEGAALTRSGANPGDSIYLAGTVGRAAAGLDLLLAGVHAGRDEPALADLIDSQLAARPDYSAVPRMAAFASAMIDVSDGLSTDLGRISTGSGIHAALEAAALSDLVAPLLPAARWLTDRNLAEEEGTSASAERLALSWVLGGGEDHGFLATSSQISPPPVGWRRIGEVRPGTGVSLDGEAIAGTGFSHFGDESRAVGS